MPFPRNDLLVLVLDLLACPACRHHPLAAGKTGDTVDCPACGRGYPYRDGILQLLADPDAPRTFSQRLFDTALTAAVYDRYRRSFLARWVGMGKPFQAEVEKAVALLDPDPQDRILDLACGPGNFTAGLARAVPRGLVLGCDLSRPMLRRARRHLAREGLHHVLWLQADALNLPLRDACLSRLCCFGGIHLFPRLHQAAAQMARVLAAGGRLVGLTLAPPRERWARVLLQPVALADTLVAEEMFRQAFGAAGFTDILWEQFRLVAYFRACRTAAPLGKE